MLVVLTLGALELLASAGPAAPAVDGEARPGGGIDTIRVTDDLGRTLVLPAPATRIVSLVPAATEILFAIGAGDKLVGRTRFDVHPPEATAVPDVGDGVRPSAEVVLQRRPDAVILFAGPDNQATVAEFDRLGIPTLAMFHNSLEDLVRNTLRLGLLSGRSEAADELTAAIEAELARVGEATRNLAPKSVYYDLWPSPPITIGAGSYLDSLISLAGGRNIFSDLDAPSPQVSLEAIVVRDPDLVLIPVEAGVTQQRPAERSGWQSIPAVREGRVAEVDASLVHRLGPRLGEAAAALAIAIHPTLASELGEDE